MELQIQDLVSSIKKEGIERADQESAVILAEAKKKAEAIVAEAKAEAARTVENAKAEVEIFQNSARLNAEQAKRDAVLAFRKEIQAEFEKLLAAEVRKAMGPQTMTTLIRAALNGERVSDYTVEVSEVTESLKSELAEELKNGLELRPTKKVQAGFRLAAKDGSGYFDCSDEAVSEMLMPFFRDTRL